MSGFLNSSVRVYPINLEIGMLDHMNNTSSKHRVLDICWCAFNVYKKKNLASTFKWLQHENDTFQDQHFKMNIYSHHLLNYIPLLKTQTVFLRDKSHRGSWSSGGSSWKGFFLSFTVVDSSLGFSGIGSSKRSPLVGFSLSRQRQALFQGLQ